MLRSCIRKFSSKKLKDIAPTMKYLNVAEKHDAAKTITNFLSNGTARRREGYSVYNKIFDFDANVRGVNSKMVMTSVSGHLLNYAFLPSYKGWRNCDPVQLFDAPIRKLVTENGEPIKRTLEREIKSCQGLIIWTDCDREGENIGFEIIEVCKAARPNLQIYRAKFSEITAASIRRALSNLLQPDMGQNLAVEVRMEMDLRTGAAFTRYQTLRLQRLFPQNIADKLISYGSCQIPTLGFVCERYKEAEEFVSEPFWKLRVLHTKDDLTVEFTWDRVRLFNKEAVEAYLMLCLADPKAKVENVTVKPKSKWRPLPMDTVEMEKLGSRKLKINAKDMMAIAEKLYNQGFISYPRTETNSFSKEINLQNLVEQQAPHPQWGEFANRVLEWGPNPRNGNKSDQAHPPIHPIKLAPNLSGNEARVYELIARHFLACVSKDATGSETIVNITIAEEKFHANGLVIFERNYLDVYPYEKWNAKQIHHYELNEEFDPTEISMQEGATTAPPLLTEADLIGLMEKHGIGTDATHAEHIHKIKERGYIGEVDRGFLVPGTIGMGLWEGYNAMEMELAKPVLRAQFEVDLKKICSREKDPKIILQEQINQYKEAYRKITDRIAAMDEKFGLRINEVPTNRRRDDNNDRDGRNGGTGSGGRRDDDDDDNNGGGGPSTNRRRDEDNNDRDGHNGGTGSGGRRDDDDDDDNNGNGGPPGNGAGAGRVGAYDDNQQQKLIQEVFKCPKCNIGHMALKTKKDKSGYFLSCLNFPDCKNAIWFEESAIKEVNLSEELCNCSQDNDTHKLEFKFKQLSYLAMLNANSTKYLTCIRCDTTFREIFKINLDKVKATGRIVSDKNTGFDRWEGFGNGNIKNLADQNKGEVIKNAKKNKKTTNSNQIPKKRTKPSTTNQKKSKTLPAPNNTRQISTTSSFQNNNLDLALDDINFDDSWGIEMQSDQNLLNDEYDDFFSSVTIDLASTNQSDSNTNKDLYCGNTTWGTKNNESNQFKNNIHSNYNNNSASSSNVNQSSWFTSSKNIASNNTDIPSNNRINENQSQSSYKGWDSDSNTNKDLYCDNTTWGTKNNESNQFKNNTHSNYNNNSASSSNVNQSSWFTSSKNIASNNTDTSSNNRTNENQSQSSYKGWDSATNSPVPKKSKPNDNLGSWGTASSSNSRKIKCPTCQRDAQELTVKKEGPNKDRKFFKCTSNCNFFKWADEIEADNSKFQNVKAKSTIVSKEPNEEMKCTICNIPAKSLIVRKEGPNKGRPFYTCSNSNSCGFFKWDDENSNPNTNETNNWGTVQTKNKSKPTKNRNDNETKKRKCGLCRLDGHTRLKCPRKAEFETDM